MKHRVYLFCVMLLATSACRESKKIVGQPVIGTPLSLQLPSGFYREQGKNGLFLHNVYDANIAVNSVPAPYDSAAAEFTKERLKALHQELISVEPVEITGIKGLLCLTALNIEGNNYKRWRLVLPEGNNTITVAGTFSILHEKDLASSLKKMLLNTQMDANWQPDMGQLDFTVKPAGELKLTKMLDGPAVMYTADGQWLHKSIYACSFLCGSNESGYIKRKAKYTENALRQICPKCEIGQQDSLMVDGLNAQEIWGTEEDSLVTRLRYEAIVFDSLKCYYFIGTAEKDNDARLKAFKSSVRTWRKKDNKDSSI